MNENINLCEILKGHEGETFYSPTFGNLTLFAINFQTLEFTSIENDTVAVESSGKFYDKADEIVVFPSKDQKDWIKWIEEQKSEVPKTWSELYNNKNSFVDNELYTIDCLEENVKTPIEKSVLALLKIHQLIEVGYGGNVTNEEWFDWDNCIYFIEYNGEDKEYKILTTVCYKKHIAFHTKEQAEEFLSYHENVQLLKDYFMIN